MRTRKIIFTFFSFLIFIGSIAGQCPMCRMSAESNLKDGGTAGAGLNAGILYMLVMPYMIVAAMGYWWYKNKYKPQVTDQKPEEV